MEVSLEPENIEAMLRYLVPGAIILYIRNFFITGRQTTLTSSLLFYLIFSIFYTYLLSFFVQLFEFKKVNEPIFSFLSVIAFPSVVGLIFGWLRQRDRDMACFRKIGLNPVHPVPTAWDWVFANKQNCFVKVVTKDDKVFRGAYGSRSFSSSDPSERDIFIEEIWCIGKNGAWQKNTESTSMLIRDCDIKRVVFWNSQPNSDGD